MNVQEINKALVRFTKAGKRHAEEKVNVVYLPLAEKMMEATKDNDNPWPAGSCGKTAVNNSEDLQDIFVNLSKIDKDTIIRECKFVVQNYEAIQDYVAKNGWRTISYMQRFEKKLFSPETEASEDTATGEDTGKDSGEDTAPTVKDVAYFADKLASLIAEAKVEGISIKDIIGHAKTMANAA